MNRTTLADWYAEVERAFEKLRAECDQVVVGGLSMGGALALWLAANHPHEVAGLVLVNPPSPARTASCSPYRWSSGVAARPRGIGNDIKKPGVSEPATPTPLKALHSMMQGWKRSRADLPKVTQPVLMFRSREDHVVDGSPTRNVLAGISSRDVTERVLEDSYHVATLDNDAPQIFAESAAFIARVTG